MKWKEIKTFQLIERYRSPPLCFDPSALCRREHFCGVLPTCILMQPCCEIKSSHHLRFKCDYGQESDSARGRDIRSSPQQLLVPCCFLLGGGRVEMCSACNPEHPCLLPAPSSGRRRRMEAAPRSPSHAIPPPGDEDVGMATYAGIGRCGKRSSPCWLLRSPESRGRQRGPAVPRGSVRLLFCPQPRSVQPRYHLETQATSCW